jgi:hypothetical protein
MEFRDYAATQTSEVITRLLAGVTAQSRQQLSALRAALDEAASALQAALEAKPMVDGRASEELVELLTRAASAQADEQAARAVEPLKAELASHADEVAALAGSLEESQAQAEMLRREIESARADAERFGSQLEARQAELDAARGEVEQLRSERARFEEVASAAQGQAEAAEAKLDAVTGLFKTSTARVKALERGQEEHDRLVKSLQAKLQAKGGGGAAAPGGDPLSTLDDLLGSFEALSGATTIADVLTTLTEQLAADFSRVALFRVKGNRLEGEHQIGIDLPADVGKVVMPLSMDSLLTRAATSGALLRLTGAELADSSRAPFAGAPTCALALPLIVNGEPLAVVYADDSGQGDSDRPPVDLERSGRVADALRQHTVALLSRLTSELKALAELKAYAALLLKEMEDMYKADVDAGQTGETLLNLLRSNLEYARSIYTSRVTNEGTDATSLLEDQITALIESRSDSKFVSDLAAALGRTGAEAPQARKSARG